MKGFNPQMRVDQLSEYRTSVHGKRNAAGDERVAVCVDCHGVHGIRPPKDPRSPVHAARVAETCGRCHNNVELMRAYGLPSNQYAGYKTSVHAHALYDKGDVSSPTCNDCHGSHGAAPPGMQTVVQVCGSCHTREATLFREIEKKKGLDLTPCIQCMVCHDNHAVQTPTDDMLGVGPRSTCTSCHGAGTAPYGAAEEMAAALDRLKARVGEASDLLSRAERAGIEVSADQFALRKARDQVVEARVLAHSFDRVRFLAVTAEGLTVADAGARAGQRAFKELRQRRLGLAVSLVVIFAVIVGLVFKVRQIEGQAE
jgi:predicted CXXCH cytochrome family protein